MRPWASWRASSTPTGAASAARRSSRRRWCSTSCCGDARATRATQMAGKTLGRDGRAAASTTSSAGGFARYGVDRAWVVPHFEKMLYDNAQLLSVYARWARARRRRRQRRSRADVADFMLAELGTARRRLRLGAGRGLRGRGGHLLRVDARAARGGARPRRRRLGGRAAHRHRQGDLRERHLDAPAPVAARRLSERLGAGAAGCSTRGRRGSGRPATTRWWPPGTDWRSAGSVTPGCVWPTKLGLELHDRAEAAAQPAGLLASDEGARRQLLDERDDLHPRQPGRLRHLARRVRRRRVGATATCCPTSSAPRTTPGSARPYHGPTARCASRTGVHPRPDQPVGGERGQRRAASRPTTSTAPSRTAPGSTR